MGAWWDQKAEMLKKYWFFKCFLKGQRRKAILSPGVSGLIRGRKSDIFYLKCFLFISRMVVPTEAGNLVAEEE